MKRWQMRRNCSLTPKQLLMFYIALVCLSLIVATGFFLAGVWVISIFTAIELCAVTIGFLIYCRHALDSETIEIEDKRLLIKKCIGHKETLYEFNNPGAFGELLNWLETNVWKDVDADICSASIEFYKTKSLVRINKFLEKYPNLKPVTNIDGVEVKGYDYYLNKIDWEYFATAPRPGFLHGDLQFDNIVISDSGEFKIIDWRHEFAGIVEYGDIYYDLAKLAGGLIINYANIKNHNFNVEIDNDSVTLSIPSVEHITVYQERLKKYILDNKLDYNKVQQLIPIIFWNMSPLHTAPFDLFLWYLGIKLFQELENA